MQVSRQNRVQITYVTKSGVSSSGVAGGASAGSIGGCNDKTRSLCRLHNLWTCLYKLGHFWSPELLQRVCATEQNLNVWAYLSGQKDVFSTTLVQR